jgi:hypothetical protein
MYIHICYVLFCSVLCWFTSLYTCMCLVLTCVKHNVVNTNKNYIFLYYMSVLYCVNLEQLYLKDMLAFVVYLK